MDKIQDFTPAPQHVHHHHHLQL